MPSTPHTPWNRRTRCLALAGLLLSRVPLGAAPQHTTGGHGGQTVSSPAPAPSQSSGYPASSRDAYGISQPIDPSPLDSEMRRSLEEKRGKLINAERHKLMLREADQLMHTAEELQMSVAREPEGAEREQAFHRADQVEKLAKDVKERMKGSR